MKLLINTIHSQLLHYDKNKPLSNIIYTLKDNGFTAGEIKKALIDLQELKVIEIERVDFVTIDFIFK